MRRELNEFVSATNAISSMISGSGLARPGEKAQASNITVQVIPDDDSSFEVYLEAGINSHDGAIFTKIGEWKNTDDCLLSIFPISLNCLYRFRHVSGVQCRVKLTG